MKAKKGLAIAMAALLSLTALAGCSGGAKEAPADQQKAADTAAGDTKAEQPDNAGSRRRHTLAGESSDCDTSL